MHGLLDLLERAQDVRLDLKLIQLRRRERALLEEARQPAREEKSADADKKREGCSPLALLLDILLAAVHDLLHNADVLLRYGAHLLRKRRRVLVDLIARRTGCGEEL